MGFLHVPLPHPCEPCEGALPGVQDLIRSLQGLSQAIRGFEEGQARVASYMCPPETLTSEALLFYERLMTDVPEVSFKGGLFPSISDISHESTQ